MPSTLKHPINAANLDQPLDEFDEFSWGLFVHAPESHCNRSQE